MDLGRYVAPAFSDEVPIAAIIDDAVILAISAVRLAAKNLIIVRALRDHVDYDDEWYLSAIHSEFEALASEKDHDARRVERELAAARTKRGRGTHPSDYRTADVATLARRKLILNALAHQLRTMATDVARAHTILATARVNALDEMTASMRDPSPSLALTSGVGRTRALRELADELKSLASPLD